MGERENGRIKGKRGCTNFLKTKRVSLGKIVSTSFFEYYVQKSAQKVYGRYKIQVGANTDQIRRKYEGNTDQR